MEPKSQVDDWCFAMYFLKTEDEPGLSTRTMTENIAEERDITDLQAKFESGLFALRTATTTAQRTAMLDQLQELNRKIAKAQRGALATNKQGQLSG